MRLHYRDPRPASAEAEAVGDRAWEVPGPFLLPVEWAMSLGADGRELRVVAPHRVTRLRLPAVRWVTLEVRSSRDRQPPIAGARVEVEMRTGGTTWRVEVSGGADGDVDLPVPASPGDVWLGTLSAPGHAPVVLRQLHQSTDLRVADDRFRVVMLPEGRPGGLVRT